MKRRAPRQETYFTWAWTPYRVNKAEQTARERESAIILPNQPSWQLSDESAIAHFSQLRDGDEYSWVWLFPDQPQAVALRLLPRFLPEDDPASTLISSTLPGDRPGQPKECYLQELPADWLSRCGLLEEGIKEIWLGFNYRHFVKDRNLRAATSEVLSTDEFLSLLATA